MRAVSGIGGSGLPADSHGADVDVGRGEISGAYQKPLILYIRIA
jgi:hypothetical protein